MEGLGLEEGGGEGGVLPVVQSVLQHLLSREVLYPSLKEITDKVRGGRGGSPRRCHSTPSSCGGTGRRWGAAWGAAGGGWREGVLGVGWGADGCAGDDGDSRDAYVLSSSRPLTRRCRGARWCCWRSGTERSAALQGTSGGGDTGTDRGAGDGGDTGMDRGAGDGQEGWGRTGGLGMVGTAGTRRSLSLSQYPEWLQRHRAALPEEQYERYRAQHGVMGRICRHLEAERPEDSDGDRRARFEAVLELMQQVGTWGRSGGTGGDGA